MITFTDDREAEFWRDFITAWISSNRTHTPTDDDQGALACVAEAADAAVLEYRKRCDQPIVQEGGPCGWCDPSYRCWTAGKPCVKVAKCPPEVDR